MTKVYSTRVISHGNPYDVLFLVSKLTKDEIRRLPLPAPKVHKRCPVCRFDRTFAGPVCPRCTKLGYRPDKDGRIRRKV